MMEDKLLKLSSMFDLIVQVITLYSTEIGRVF